MTHLESSNFAIRTLVDHYQNSRRCRRNTVTSLSRKMFCLSGPPSACQEWFIWGDDAHSFLLRKPSGVQRSFKDCKRNGWRDDLLVGSAICLSVMVHPRWRCPLFSVAKTDGNIELAYVLSDEKKIIRGIKTVENFDWCLGFASKATSSVAKYYRQSSPGIFQALSKLPPRVLFTFLLTLSLVELEKVPTSLASTTRLCNCLRRFQAESKDIKDAVWKFRGASSAELKNSNEAHLYAYSLWLSPTFFGPNSVCEKRKTQPFNDNMSQGKVHHKKKVDERLK